MRGLWSDLRGGMRILMRRPAFAATVVLVLGLGIGTNTLVFLVADAVLLRPLPYPNPSQLVWISQGVSPTRAEYALAPDFAAWRTEVQAFAQVAAFSERFRNFAQRGEPERILSAEVSSEFLTLPGVSPASGRDFLAADERPGGDRVAILTHGFCSRRFGGAQNCLGETIKLDEEFFEVVGVLPDHFRFPEPLDVQVFTPLSLGPEQASREASRDAGIRQIKVIARLRPSITTAQAQAELSAVQQRIVQAYPQFQDGREARLSPLHEHLSAGVSHAALVLLGAVGFLWALGCLNVGSLLLARTVSRRGEMAIRLSLGASRLHLLRQVLAENAVLALIGCARKGMLPVAASGWVKSHRRTT
jgi:putative ABC transport system permease protein